MKIFEDVNIPARTEKKCVALICDFCGKQGRQGGWKESCFDVDETEISVKIRAKEGKQYPECGWGEEFSCDMCPDCFRDKLVPFLQSITKRPLDYEEWDW